MSDLMPNHKVLTPTQLIIVLGIELRRVIPRDFVEEAGQDGTKISPATWV